MAKALFHKSQRVYVKPVGTYALVEKVIPHWVKGVEEPLRVTYDCGLGRDFKAAELVSEDTMRGQSQESSLDDILHERWSIQRQKNRYQDAEDTADHPHPGSYPVVQTDDSLKGGWRVPGAEYNRDPSRIEYQARIVVNAPDMLRVCKALIKTFQNDPASISDELKPHVKRAGLILRHVHDLSGEDTQLQAAE